MSTAANVSAVVFGRPATELTDAELEAQGTQAHATRNWVFLHGTAEQFARHTSRMLELEQEYLRRHPHRTWQGSGGAAVGRRNEAAALRSALRGIVAQLDALAAEPVTAGHPATPATDPVRQLLAVIAEADGGRLHKLEVHQTAREAGLDRTALAALYTADPALLVVDKQDRVITEAGRVRLQRFGWRPTVERALGELIWTREDRPVWDASKQRIIGRAEPGVFQLSYSDGMSLPGDWWLVSDSTASVVGYGWMDVTWGEAEVLLAVDLAARAGGVGSFILEHLEQEAADRGLNYVFNKVSPSHPDHDTVSDWLAVRGYQGNPVDGILRKQIPHSVPPAVQADSPSAPSSGSDLGPGREDSGGYVNVEDHQY